VPKITNYNFTHSCQRYVVCVCDVVQNISLSLSLSLSLFLSLSLLTLGTSTLDNASLNMDVLESLDVYTNNLTQDKTSKEGILKERQNLKKTNVYNKHWHQTEVLKVAKIMCG